MASVLIVDDEELSRIAVRKLLSRLFPSVLVAGEAATGRAAVELALSLRPDVVLMDIRIPGMNGMEAAQAILSGPRRVKVIVLSAYDSFAFAQRAINIGVSGYLLKPVSEADFEAVFGGALAEIEEPSAAAERGRRPSAGAKRPPYPLEAEAEFFRAIARGEGEADPRAMVEALRSGGPEHFAERCLEFLSSFKRELRALGLSPEAAEASGFPSASEIASCPDPSSLEASLARGVVLALQALEEARCAGPRAAIERAIASLPLGELGLERVAERVGMNPQRLSRLFKELFGLRFVEYTSGLRVEAAKTILSEEELTVRELCRRLGWTDSAHFTKVFKSRTGLAPKAYARRLGSVRGRPR